MIDFKMKVECNATHKKTGKGYQVLSTNVVDCTNERDGTRTVLYYRDGMFFVREYAEFMEKFDVSK